ncbi:hypothetical protein [Arthrobacter sp. zg-Y844]|uniref:hypothetical protein n=1 Tax=Arthrobacter sp. zg-Y844 TaxID=2964612 RepID=UPI0021022C34|nr:hypothetical protein [Arthrobacter sp. zg-Y844]MCQ1987409.1 hypothetical protein [Arthrobacter sp. zg-Y844]
MLEPLLREESRFCSIGRPHDWEIGGLTDSADLVLAAPVAAEGAFRPSVVVNSFPYTGSMEKLSTLVLSYAHAMLQDVYFISVDRFPPARGEGRIIEYTYSSGGLAVHCRVDVHQTAGHGVLVTTSCASAELGAYDDVLELMCSSAQIKEPA